ncbi:MAG: ABC transporter ATP-binding protein [Zetaproteobacteria bacterium CG_4_10_14_0_2_um_filter_55_20]|nr:MAG: ABC transporter ATP-binding protein [Zetaproteobacteria bacterium CG1_02_55_237]PIS19265.1 MAG: ABC transporter ATP-binding protein [Zetaproteobacteria bacterium CG08_land_8_20_14_0_20_55_17]PIY54388.1 MAG: ABC transporter ATP-binding protein [Zetaproteobacteria bacterium CG_4_10_14_0_8_um_filter_55_43]PIZ39021.1 MAG: ABC transporter ATP-binding protein [Zetaproteobacteria bacterium CG_4_10_14_0_2_um_filter_55_20]PJB80326.1 MAG: ABC transporter ATP-binding protein [Zetaproteobacteria ba
MTEIIVAEPVAVFTGVGKSFVAGKRRVEALRGVSARLRAGCVTGLIGPDGAGKTTLMRLLAGLLKPDAGEIHVLGQDVIGEPLRVQQSLGYMPQRFGLYEDLSVQENLDLYADLQCVAHAARPERYAELMHMTGLAPFTHRLAGQLSGGMKQKLGLACALVRSPKLLLLDEPTAGVDPVSRRELWEIVYRQVEQAGMSVLFSTAYLDEAERCDDLLLLHQGQLLGQGKPAEFSSRMQGRIFNVSNGSESRRRLQQQLVQQESVLDALIQGEAVRLVMHEGRSPQGEVWAKGLKIEQAAPRFEDAFVAMLGGVGAIAPEAVHAAATVTAKNGPVIEVADLSRNFGEFQAVKSIGFHVERGEVFGLLGANGAGKSTTFRMLCGLLPASSGSLTVAGMNLRDAPASARSRIGYMSQRFSLYGTLSVLENLRFFSSVYGLSGKGRRARIDWAFERFDLHDIADTASDDLSLGYKQRLAMAAALLHEPDILFLDEPTSGVDPLARREFWQRINLLAEQGVTVLVTTHFMEEAEYCDRLVIMAEGSILASGTPQAIKQTAAATGEKVATMEDAFIALIQREAA